MAKILILVNPATLQILSTKDYLLSFELFSPAWMSQNQKNRRSENDYVSIFSRYDAIVISQHLRVCFDGWINDELNAALSKFGGVKALFLHDEYDHTEKAREWIQQQKVDLVYTVVPEQHVEKVYDPKRFPKTTFKSILTGYFPLKFAKKINRAVPIVDRDNLLIYRGRVSPESYGKLAKQKEDIGRFFDEYCDRNEITADIQWEEAERVYGLDWYRLLETGVATLGTESGSNVFDEYGLIREHVLQGRSLPGPKELNFREENLGFKMNQISARLFEAIGCGTGLVLYRGSYSGILEADKHYLALELDHSNADEVIEKLCNPKLMQAMVDRTWEHVSSNDKLQFSHLIKLFDQDIDMNVSLQNNQSKADEYGQDLLVGDFSDVSATGIGVFSALHQDAQAFSKVLPNVTKPFLLKLFGHIPVLKRFLKWTFAHIILFRKKAIYGLIVFKQKTFHWLRKAYRLIPNAFPVLGQLKRKAEEKIKGG